MNLFFTLLTVATAASFSLGDELGFSDSLSNVESKRRRGLSYRNGANTIGVLPANNLPSLSNVQQNIGKSFPIGVSPRPKVLTSNRQQVKHLNRRKSNSQLMTEAASVPLGVPPFKPIPKQPIKPNNQEIKTVTLGTLMAPSPFKPVNIPKSPFTNTIKSKIQPFQAMPSSISRISTGEILEIENNYASDQTLPQVQLYGHTVEELAAAANVSVETIKNAIYLRQQQLISEQKTTSLKDKLAGNITQTMTTTPTTTIPSTKKFTMKPSSIGNRKVMNAPKEYYPAGYEKNFDDNFTAKVDLPYTLFTCGDQKHFPGLYADVNLGCMVFHVCALTDDGLIMKSFLCPESTLFDQTILKCNWWFYVDCKNSKSLYDSNIPISKSYQLMKSITYFSNYKNSNPTKEGVDIESIRNAVMENNTTQPT